MSLLLKGGISKLSELEIDADKDWQGKGIANIKEVVAGMAIGDILQHDGVRLVRLPAGVAHQVLTSEGLGHLVVWAPGGTYFYRFFPVSIDSSHGESVVTVDHVRELLAPVESPYVGSIVPTLNPSVATLPAAVVTTEDESAAHMVVPDTVISWVRMDKVGGAVADDGGVQTDETVVANSPTGNDMHLLPSSPQADDAYYFGYTLTFDQLLLNQSQRGIGDWTISWEYWNGVSWAALTGVNDATDGFKPMTTGRRSISFAAPGDWGQCDVAGVGSMYWIRARVSAFGSISQQPLGAQAWIVTATS
jgi:hypothetical protein